MESVDLVEAPELSNQLIDSIIGATAEEPDEAVEPEIDAPVDVVVDLPGGYMSLSGEIVTEAEVRELTGRDEEVIARATSTAKVLQTVLMRGIVRVGNEKVSEEMLDVLLSGDRDFLLVNIFAATFGRYLEIAPYCPSCSERVETHIDLLKDIPIKRLDDPRDRNFLVKCGVGDVAVSLPTGETQKKMMSANSRSVAEMSTILLTDTITKLRGLPVMSEEQVLDLPIKDRRKISEEILTRNPGPQMQDIKTKCPKCDTELEVPLSLAGMFQF